MLLTAETYSYIGPNTRHKVNYILMSIDQTQLRCIKPALAETVSVSGQCVL